MKSNSRKTGKRLARGAATFAKQSRTMLYKMSTSAGARDTLRWWEYRNKVIAQRSDNVAASKPRAEA